MAANKTLTMIKPDAVKAGHTGAILAQINEAGFRIVALKMTQLSTAAAERFMLYTRNAPSLANSLSS